MSRERWSAGGLALLALAYLVAARRYPLDTLATPGPGIVPLIAGVALLVTAVVVCLGGRSASPARPGDEPTAPSRQGPALLLAVTLVLYVALLPRLGFLASSFALVLIASRLMGLLGWWRPAALALGVTLASHVLFARWLGVPLP